MDEFLQSWLPICDEHCLVVLFIELRHEHNELLEEVSPVAHVFIWGNTVGNRDKIPTLVFAYKQLTLPLLWNLMSGMLHPKKTQG